MTNNYQKKTATNFNKVIRNGVFIPAYILGAFAISIVLTYFQWFRAELNFPLSKDPAVWGQFGDFVGGVLNPICAYMAFVWLVRSYALQKSELAETRMALEQSQKAQLLQAQTSYAASRINAISIQLNLVVSQAEIQREKVQKVINERLRGVITAEFCGKVLPIVQVEAAHNMALNDLGKRQLDLMAKIEAIETELNVAWKNNNAGSDE